ncbi:MAG: hypothetical protein EOO46_19385 [Flavobacterium sp.]|nr:MAG: hypothetical protein EOO46_19385 [Flavobacterium sp.]
MGLNKLILVGNGFDLAHGLKTSYRNFIDWYFCEAFKEFCSRKSYSDALFELKNKYTGYTSIYKEQPNTFEEVLEFISFNTNQSIIYHSKFIRKLIEMFRENSWVDIERYYFQLLKSYFSNQNLDKRQEVSKLNSEFNYLIVKLTEYIDRINENLPSISKLELSGPFAEVFTKVNSVSEVKVLNFNYTDTVSAKGYLNDEDIIHIHGRASDRESNPIIFGYGDETDPIYQNIEDSGENIFLEHIKSFGYFRTNNYHRLLSYIDSRAYEVYIIGHSCGLSDRVLLNEIFENQNCKKIHIYYHRRIDGTDNFKEITQEISRHFKPQNKNSMRRKIVNKNRLDIIPQIL